MYTYYISQNHYLTVLSIQSKLWSGIETTDNISNRLIQTIRYYLYYPFVVPPFSEEG